MKKTITKWVREQGRAAWATVFDNPVVLRDLRAQMRGTKSYWFIGSYLLLLSILAVAGYGQATHQGLGSANTVAQVNIVDAQGQLSQMYYFIFGTIAALILLIAPALTAASIVGERQRLSFDLLVTTPLKASEILAGKLISSIAFLGLLLGLSLPAAALCVILGGATLGDVLRTYAQFAIDGTVLAAIGLFFSCAAKTNLLAVIWSYATVGALFYLTFALYTANAAHDIFSPLLGLVVLNPIVAITTNTGLMAASYHSGGALSVELFGLSLPLLLVSAGFAFLAIRLCVTASTYRLGVYGAQAASSLRRQILVITGITAFLFGQAFFVSSAYWGNGNSPADQSAFTDWVSSHCTGFVVFLIGGFLLGGAFLPALFVPASRDEDLPGALHQQIAGDTSLFRFRKAFQPVHSGAFPFYVLWLLTLTGGAFAAFAIAMQKTGGLNPFSAGTLLSFAVLGVAYVGGLGFLLWQISRFAGSAVKTIAGARGLSFGIFALLSAAPLMALALSNAQHPEKTALATFTFLFYPLMVTQNSPTLLCAGMRGALLTTTILSLVLGMVFAMLRKGIAARSDRHSNALAQAVA